MRKNGFFLTFMALILIGSVLALQTSTTQFTLRDERSRIDQTAFEEINQTFTNIYNQILVSKEGYAGKVQGRIIPLKNYEKGQNWFEITQEFPAEQETLDETYDALNLFSIFSSAKNSRSDLHVNVFALRNDDWGGSEENPPFTYIIEPQCVKSSIGTQDGGTGNTVDVMQFFEGDSLEGDPCDFPDPTSETLGDINSFIVRAEIALLGICDVKSSISNTITCSGGLAEPPKDGENGCAMEVYDSSETQPFAFVHIVFTDCFDGTSPECASVFHSSNPDFPAGFPDGEYFIYGHFNPLDATESLFKFTGCGTGQGLSIDFVPDDGLLFRTNQKDMDSDLMEIDITNRITFNSPIEFIQFSGVDLSIKKKNFDYCRATYEQLCD